MIKLQRENERVKNTERKKGTGPILSPFPHTAVLYQQDGHLISLHSGTTTANSINDKSY